MGSEPVPPVRFPFAPAKSPLRNLMPTISAQPAEVADPPPKTLRPLQQRAHVRGRVGIAFQAVSILGTGKSPRQLLPPLGRRQPADMRGSDPRHAPLHVPSS